MFFPYIGDNIQQNIIHNISTPLLGSSNRIGPQTPIKNLRKINKNVTKHNKKLTNTRINKDLYLYFHT